jgi:hypothetical protein
MKDSKRRAHNYLGVVTVVGTRSAQLSHRERRQQSHRQILDFQKLSV